MLTLTGLVMARQQVVHRLPLGPRQGLAIVRIGEQLVAVSVGEGGVRPVLELDLFVHAALAPLLRK